MRKKIIGGVVVVGLIASAGVAWAAITGIVNVPDVVQGIGSGGGASSCQTSAVVFDVPEPTWNNTVDDWAVTSIDFSGITTACVNLGTADLLVTITDGGGTVLADGQSLNMGASSGSIGLSAPVPFDMAANADYNFIVRNA